MRHELELSCEADKIPGQIEIDVTGLEVGDSIHISSVTLPKGAESAITDRDFTIATIVAPSALKRAEGESSDEDGDETDPGSVAATEQGPDADAAEEQADKSE